MKHGDFTEMFFFSNPSENILFNTEIIISISRILILRLMKFNGLGVYSNPLISVMK